jgi:hypothetical protein
MIAVRSEQSIPPLQLLLFLRGVERVVQAVGEPLADHGIVRVYAGQLPQFLQQGITPLQLLFFFRGLERIVQAVGKPLTDGGTSSYPSADAPQLP